jgi:hypothetical protein
MPRPSAGRSPPPHRKFRAANHPGDPVLEEKPVRSFRTVFTQVMIVQLISLAVLWWLQARYGR